MRYNPDKEVPGQSIKKLALEPAATLEESLKRVKELKTWLNKMYFERDELVDVMMVALAAKEHAVFIGTPGIAKSAVVRSLMEALGADYFEYLLTKFSEPNEVFGSVDPTKIMKGEYVRVTTGRLPEAQLAFLDEAFKANSAILNALLTILNERLFHNAGMASRTPLHSAFMASNELPEEGKEANLSALWDRCLLRVNVVGIKDENKWSEMVFERPAASSPPRITLADFEAIHAYSETLPFSKKVREACMAINKSLQNEFTPKLMISDRRWRKAAQKIMSANAALRGAKEVEDEDVSVLKHVLWDNLTQIDKVKEIVDKYAAAWKADTDRVAGKLREANTRLNNAKAMSSGSRLRALADLTDLMESIGDEAKTLHRQYNKSETAKLVEEAARITNDTLAAARPTPKT